jgi:hypothetical protein
VAPHQAEGLDWLAGMGPENVDEFGAAAAGKAALTQFLDSAAAALGTVTGADVAQALGGLVIAADHAALTGEFANYVTAALRASMNTGIAGWRDDDLAFVKDWGFPSTRASARPPRSSPSGKATRTRWSRSRTASGWPRTSLARAPTCSRVKVISP